MEIKKYKVILIEDNKLLSENISMYLSLKDIEVKSFESVEEAEKNVNKLDYNVLILDINLPWKSGLEYLEELRSKWFKKPIIMLTSNNTSNNIVEWFEKWADDYISKPFNFEEFVARIKNISRRAQSYDIEKVILEIQENEKINNIEIDLEYKKIKKNWVNVYLPTLEYKLIEYLVKNRWKVISRDILYEEVWWEFDKYQISRTVDVYIWYLRKKLGKDVIKTKKWDWYFIE